MLRVLGNHNFAAGQDLHIHDSDLCPPPLNLSRTCPQCKQPTWQRSPQCRLCRFDLRQHDALMFASVAATYFARVCLVLICIGSALFGWDPPFEMTVQQLVSFRLLLWGISGASGALLVIRVCNALTRTENRDAIEGKPEEGGRGDV